MFIFILSFNNYIYLVPLKGKYNRLNVKMKSIK